MKDPTSFVKTTAAFFLALSILCLLVDLIAGLFLFFTGNAYLRMQSEWVKIMGPAQSWRMAHMAPYYATHGLLSLTTLAASLAILFRKSWGLKLFSAVLVGLIFIHLWNLGFNLSGFFTMPDKMILGGVSFPRGLMIFSWGMGAAISLFFLVLYGWLLKNFRGKEVKNMFYKSGGKDEK